MTAFRWWLLEQINTLAWWVCPEPHRHHMEASWEAVKNDWIDEMCNQVRMKEKWKETFPENPHDTAPF